ncbi:MAG: hypothetical protein EOP50_00910 [Sphingobacteriales bacterium]|nr:MAG: hypothetical protein EOP50_00910 [Sphingobacteriales bacterium]
MKTYLVISQAVADQWQGARAGVNTFYARPTLAGVWVVADTAPNEFPEAFTGAEEAVQLRAGDFPPEPPETPAEPQP